MENLKSKTVFISGASSGIGAACAEIFARNGCRLILCARSYDKLHELAAGLKERFQTEVLLFELDVRDREAVEAAIAALPDKWRRIDILINNAGLALGLEKLYQNDIDDWDQMIDTNIKGLLYLTRQVVPLMIEAGIAGHIINIGSNAGIAAYPNGAVYCATKAAVKFISDGLRMDLVELPFRVTNIQPGLVETNFSITRFHGDKARANQFYKGIKPLIGADIAEVVFFCAAAPPHVQIGEVTVTPIHQATAMVVHRKV